MRSVRNARGVSVTVILLLGFGIGANTALFSLFRAILMRPIPGVRDSGELVRVRRSANGTVQINQSYPDYLDFRGRSKTVQELVAERLVAFRLAGPPAQIVNGAIVTGNYFGALGAKPAAGRLLGSEDDRVPGGHPVVVVSEAFWRRQLGSDPRAVGTTLNLNGYGFTIAGVAAAPFEGVEFGEHTEVWMPLMMVKQAMPRNAGYPFLANRSAGWLTWYGRLQRGVTLAEATHEGNAIAAQLESVYPQSNHGRRFEITAHASMSPEQRADMGRLLGLLLTAVCLVLLVACGNVANLLLACAAGRGREMAIRLALGAARGNLLRQLLGESLLLGLASGALALLLAPWMIGILGRVWHGSVEPASVPDWGVLAFALSISLVCVLLCGLAPAWSASSTNVAVVLKGASPQSGRKLGRMQRAFVAAQVALSVALVATAALVLGSMRRIVGIDPGYQARGVVMASMDLSLLGYSADRGTQFFGDLLRRVSALPRVRSASLGKSSPALDWSDRVNIFRPGEAPATGGREERAPNAIRTDRNIIAPGYFATLGIRMIAGRDFTAADRRGSPAVAIVSQALAERLWHGQNAIGRQILMAVDGPVETAPLEVIGVSADSRYRSVLNDPAPLLYIPLAQNYDSISRLMVAVDGSTGDFKEVLRKAIQQSNPDLPVRSVSTLEEQIEQSLWKQRAAAAVLTLFGVLAVALACTGIHGVVAYATAQRAREMGIRMALGARRADVVGQVAGHALGMTLAGIAIGIPVAWWAQPAVAALLYRTGSVGAITFGGVALLFLLVALLASAMPARRAAGIDPAAALRQE